MRESIREFVQICTETVTLPSPVYEFGALQVPGQEGFADLRSFFANRDYVGSDMRAGAGVDVVLDLHELDLPADSVGTALVLDTFEHVRSLHSALLELDRVLSSTGVLVASSVMNYPIHNAPHDYWRFTPQGFETLLEGFATSVVHAVGPRRLPQTVVGVGFRSAPVEDELVRLRLELAVWADRWEPAWKQVARLVSPPVLLLGYRRLRGVRGL